MQSEALGQLIEPLFRLQKYPKTNTIEGENIFFRDDQIGEIFNKCFINIKVLNIPSQGYKRTGGSLKENSLLY